MALTLVEEGQLVMDLTAEEQTELALCESVIERGRKAFLEVGGALMTIQEKRLYRATHTTFEDYLREKWEISRTHAYDMIAAFGIVENVRHAGHSEVLPENPRQALALRGVAPEEQGEVMAKAVSTAPEGGVTAAHIQKVADQHTGKDVEKAQRAEEAKETQATSAVTGFMDAPNTLPQEAEAEPENLSKKSSDESGTPAADSGQASPLLVSDHRASQAPPAPPTAPATLPPAPRPPEATPSTGNFVQCVIPSDEDDWLWENGLTAATAIAELRSARAQLYHANLSLGRPQLTDKAHRLLLALTENHNKRYPDQPLLPVQVLEATLEVRCQIVGIQLPDETNESEENDDE